MNNKYWPKFYKKIKKQKPSSFAQFVAPFIEREIVELGCGNGRDLPLFHDMGIKAFGVDSAYESPNILKQDVGEFIKESKCIGDVYTRFFWHSIDRKLQLNILKWTKGTIFIEARTTADKFRPKTFAKHERNFVNVAQLVKDLKDNKFNIELLVEGTGLSVYKGEDPHLVRVVARKNG